MAWLQNLAGKAEDILNKIDKNAATALKDEDDETKSHSDSDMNTILNDIEANMVDYVSKTANNDTEIEVIIPCDNINEDVEDDVENDLTEQIVYYEQSMEKKQLEIENLNKVILNMEHSYTELENDKAYLNSEFLRSSEVAKKAEAEMKKYKARANRVLQERNQQTIIKPDDDKEQIAIFTQNEELRIDLQKAYENNENLNKKNLTLIKELDELQKQYVYVQNEKDKTYNSLNEQLMTEQNLKETVEKEYKLKVIEVNKLTVSMNAQTNDCNMKDETINHLTEDLNKLASIQRITNRKDKLEALSNTLMLKQQTLEEVTAERNQLKFKLEKLQIAYENVVKKNRHVTVNVNSVNDTDDNSLVLAKLQVPSLMKVSPLDAGVTRRVKHAYSTLDTLSIRTGVFLRRYPLARIFVLCYIFVLHIWVIIMLFIGMPSR